MAINPVQLLIDAIKNLAQNDATFLLKYDMKVTYDELNMPTYSFHYTALSDDLQKSVDALKEFAELKNGHVWRCSLDFIKGNVYIGCS